MSCASLRRSTACMSGRCPISWRCLSFLPRFHGAGRADRPGEVVDAGRREDRGRCRSAFAGGRAGFPFGDALGRLLDRRDVEEAELHPYSAPERKGLYPPSSAKTAVAADASRRRLFVLPGQTGLRSGKVRRRYDKKRPGKCRVSSRMPAGRYLLILAHESLSVTVRLNTSFSGVESVSGQK